MIHETDNFDAVENLWTKPKYVATFLGLPTNEDDNILIMMILQKLKQQHDSSETGN